MRKQVSLYIANQLVDLDDQSFLLFNYTMEDLSNPTIVRNSFSQSITLKGTPNNNKIFGGIFRLDRKTQYMGGYTGVNFDPSRKTPFVLMNSTNEVLESGYVKLDKVSQKRGMVEYHISLYGGLGSFFYGLTYNEDGSKKTLADLRYKAIDGDGYTDTPGDLRQRGGYTMIKDCWTYLKDPQSYVQYWTNGEVDCWWAHIVNFAPAYNGLPEGFSADKAIIDGEFDNVPKYKVINSVQYGFKTGVASELLLMTNPHTEWEMRDLRWYLQRPVVNIKAIMEAICDSYNNGGYEVELSPFFFNEDNGLYIDGWVTLPMIPVEDRKEGEAIMRLMASTKSPAEYLISFAKIFGIIFLYDSSKKRVSIMNRSEFYSKSAAAIDLTDRVDIKDISISPVVGQSHFYQFGNNVIGEWASDYKKDFGVEYASQRVNTGNEFNSDVKVLTDDIIFKDAVEVQERNLLFTSNALTRDEMSGVIENFILPRYESVKLQMWGTLPGESEQSMEEIDILCPYEWNRFFFNPEYPLSDFLPKAQFHDKDNKTIDGSDVLLVFNGNKDLPKWNSWAYMTYRLTDDVDDMYLLNENTPCWNFTSRRSTLLTTLPSFRRCHTANNDTIIDSTFEWGLPQARGVNGLEHTTIPHTIYNEYWKNYLTDRYDDDTFIMSCKVDLRGLNVGQELMRRFFYYQGAIFVLNKIINHSLTTEDLTECEFVKVQDKSNYLN